APGTYLIPATDKISDTASTGVQAWAAGTVWLRPYTRIVSNGGAFTAQFKRLVVRDVTGEHRSAASAAAAFASEQAAAVHESDAGVSASASDNSRVQAEAAAASAAEAAQQALAVAMPDRYVTGSETN